MDWSAEQSEGALRLTPTPTPQRPSRHARHTCLFLIDADDSRRLELAELLEGPLEVRQFPTGEAALAALSHQCPDVALIAAALPGLDGVEIGRRLKQRMGEQGGLPVLLLVGPEGSVDRAQAAEAGIDELLHVPTHKLELRARIGTHLKLAQLQREQRATGHRLAALRGQLEEAERLATLGTFAAGVGHELNNVTTVLASALDELDRTRKFDEELSEDLHLASRRLQELAAALQHLSAPSSRATMVDLRQVITDVLLLTRLTGRTKYVAVDFTPPPSPFYLQLVAVELQQVVLNLITNAADALSASTAGRISIELAAEPGAVLLRVSDNGPGFSVEAREHLLDPHFSTKVFGLSTGLGLPLVRQLVSGWGGSAEIRTREGAGTCVEVRIPLERRGPTG